MNCSACGTKLVPQSKFCSGCGATLIAHAVLTPKKTSAGVYVVLILGFFALVALIHTVAPSDISNAHAVAFNVLDPLQFQNSCGMPSHRKLIRDDDGTPHALSIYYSRPVSDLGFDGIMVIFSDSPKTNPLNFHTVQFWSVPDNHLMDQKTAMSIIGCPK